MLSSRCVPSPGQLDLIIDIKQLNAKKGWRRDVNYIDLHDPVLLMKKQHTDYELITFVKWLCIGG